MKPPIVSESSRTRGRRGMRIVDRYVLLALVAAFAATAVVLLVVTVGGALAELLGRIARGSLPVDLLFALLGLQTLSALTVLVPLAVLVAVLIACGRMWRESEMAVLQSAGFDPAALARPLLMFALPVAALVAAVAFWLAPAAQRMARELVTEANRSLLVAGLEPGRFVELPGRDGVIFVGAMSTDGTRFERMFIESERIDAETGKTRIDVVTAARGFLYHDADGEGRYVALEDGFRVEGKLGEDDVRLMRFARNDVRLPDAMVTDSPSAQRQTLPTSRLLAADAEPAQKAEFHWRLAAPLSVVVLALAALALARSNPREPRHARLLLALLFWLVYYNLLVLGRSALGEGKIPPVAGLWWVHGPVALVALAMLRAPGRPRRQRVASTAVAERG